MKRFFLVMESCEAYEQALALDTSKGMPDGGILTWRDGVAAALFKSRSAARAAINRTHHYSLAFGITTYPERKFCSVVAAQLAAEFLPEEPDGEERRRG